MAPPEAGATQGLPQQGAAAGDGADLASPLSPASAAPESPALAVPTEAEAMPVSAALAECQAVLAREQATKLRLAQDLAETQGLLEVLTSKVVRLQVQGEEQREEIESLREKLMKSERSERERFEEVKMQAQRLREVEVELEDSQRAMANIRAPSPILHHRAQQQQQQQHQDASRFSFNKLLKNITSHLPQEGTSPSLSDEAQEILGIDGNSSCADCGQRTTLPTWVSVGHAVLLCTGCAGVHRSLGTHISKIKSLTLDRWSPAEYSRLRKLGNTKGNARLMGNAPEGFTPPVDPTEFSLFVQQKYGDRRWEDKSAAAAPEPSAEGGEEEEEDGHTWVQSVLGRLSEFVHPHEGEEGAEEIAHEPISVLADEPQRRFTPSIAVMQKPASGACEEAMLLSEELSTIGPVQRTALAKLLPVCYRERNWVRLFSNIDHGASLRVLYERVHGHGACITVIRTVEGLLLGAFSSHELHLERDYHGSGETFVFRFQLDEAGKPAKDAESWHWTEANDFLLLTKDTMLAFGGGTGPALCLDASLGKGTTDECETFASPWLVDAKTFAVQRVEVWGFE